MQQRLSATASAKAESVEQVARTLLHPTPEHLKRTLTRAIEAGECQSRRYALQQLPLDENRVLGRKLDVRGSRLRMTDSVMYYTRLASLRGWGGGICLVMALEQGRGVRAFGHCCGEPGVWRRAL